MPATLARRQVAQYNNVLSRYNKDPNTPTLTAAQIRLMVDRFSVVRKAEPPPIFSLDSHAKAYETLIRRIVINPMFRNLRTGLSQAVALREALEIIQGIDISPRRSLLVDEEVNAYFAKVNRWHERKMIGTFKKSLGVDITAELSIVETQATMDRFRRDNVSLIKTIPPRMHESLFNRMSEVFAEKPFSRAAMGVLVREEFGSVGFNARRIARDQVSKAIGQLNLVRQTGVGIEQYKWRTSQDNRVRPTHAANEGKVFDWDDPPAGTGAPGQDINCRCSAQPEIPEALVAKWPKVKRRRR